jgi:8-oxo-dGTP pyrophosphatase MutT (NUDIX family)
VSESFHVVGTKPLLQSHIFGVEQRTVAHDGATFDRDVVTHPGAVAMLAINERGEIGLIRQYRTPFDRLCWEIPAGTLDVRGENTLDAAKRELLEELGCEAERWIVLGTFMVSPGWSNQLMTIYEARELRLVARSPASPEEEGSVIAWMSPEELRAVLRGEPAIDSTLAVALNRVFGTFFDDE